VLASLLGALVDGLFYATLLFSIGIGLFVAMA